MRYQIDQSGKIEQTSLDTIIALSNDRRYCVLLPKKVKRLLQEDFRRHKRPRMFIYDTFSALIAIILLRVKPASPVFIDKEYPSNEGLIKARVLELMSKVSPEYTPEVEFTLVGKSSPAHLLAAKVGNKKIQADEIITLERIGGLLWPQKKTGYSAINGTRGNLTQDWLPGDQKPSQPFNNKRLSQRSKKVKKKG